MAVLGGADGPEVAGIPLRWQECGAPDLALYVPADPNALLADFDEEEFRRSDERMPYFGTLWPAALVLAGEVLAGPDLHGARVLDLGAGVGAAGIAAARRGARVTYLDWEPRAMPIIAASLARLGLTADALVTADWRDPPALGPFDRILGADVLYEPRNVPAVAAFLAGHLAPAGCAVLTDPGRPSARDFLPAAVAAGLVLRERHRVVPAEGPAVDVLTVRPATAEDR